METLPRWAHLHKIRIQLKSGPINQEQVELFLSSLLLFAYRKKSCQTKAAICITINIFCELLGRVRPCPLPACQTFQALLLLCPLGSNPSLLGLQSTFLHTCTCLSMLTMWSQTGYQKRIDRQLQQVSDLGYNFNQACTKAICDKFLYSRQMRPIPLNCFDLIQKKIFAKLYLQFVIWEFNSAASDQCSHICIQME